MRRKKCIWLTMVFLLLGFLCACGKENDVSRESVSNSNEEIVSTEEIKSAKEKATEQWEKGYNLPIDEKEREEAESDCKKRMELISDIYCSVYKGETANIVLKDETIHAMLERIKEEGYPVTTMEAYSNIENEESMDAFLKESKDGKSGSAVFYELHSDGSIGRNKFTFDGKDMYFLDVNGIWNSSNEPVISYVSYTRIADWKYTKEGWFCYELCVPKPPEVTEVVNGSCLIRVKPMSKEYREMSKKCVQGIGYKGNNLLCSNWDMAHMEGLDYNGMYEYLYTMKYQKPFHAEDYPNGIPKEVFESLIMEYLPITAEQIREYAVFDEEKQTYAMERLGCFNYAPTSFGTSLPEVTDIKENADGTITLTVNAVCDTMMCTGTVITHELTVQFAEDGSFKYLGNEILNDGIKYIPDYQYRVSMEKKL